MNAIYRWLEERIDLSGMRKALLDREVPDNLTWMHTLGSAAAAAFTVQIVTGVVLAMYYAPSPDHAYDSIRYLDSAIPSGALLRGMHHWGASAMVLLVGAHMIRVFTMGAYKYPREANWLVGVGLFALVMGFGFTGYLLPWDQKAFWATEVGTNIAGTMRQPGTSSKARTKASSVVPGLARQVSMPAARQAARKAAAPHRGADEAAADGAEGAEGSATVVSVPR